MGRGDLCWVDLFSGLPMSVFGCVWCSFMAAILLTDGTHKQRIERAVVVCVIWFFLIKNWVLLHIFLRLGKSVFGCERK
jgi:uncharacterized membrane protein